MSPERMARLVLWWVRCYTRGLPEAVAERRLGEIEADLHDHIAHGRAAGHADAALALSIATRMIRGMASDASWRGRARARAQRPPAYRRVAIVTGLILLVPLVGMQVSDGVDWGVFDFVFGALLLGGAGLLLDSAARRGAGLVSRVLAVVIGAAAIALGDADDAPGLVLFGGLLMAATLVLAIRRAQRSG